MVVLHITLSKIRSIAGSRVRTINILMTAPLARRVQIAPIISTLEYMVTPKVAAKRLMALVNTDNRLV